MEDIAANISNIGIIGVNSTNINANIEDIGISLFF